MYINRFHYRVKANISYLIKQEIIYNESIIFKYF
jgi:hypothetical protein